MITKDYQIVFIQINLELHNNGYHKLFNLIQLSL